MNYNEAIQSLDEMRSRYHSGFSLSDKEIIEQLYERCFSLKFTKTSCSDCWRDAYLQVYNHLKNTKTMEKRLYKLRRGVIVRPEFGSSEFYSALSITDEKAEELLKKNPSLIDSFEEYPNDWRERIANKRKEDTKICLSQERKQLFVGETLSLTTKSYHVVKEWSSSDDSVAIVNKNGVVTAISPGKCIITAVADNYNTGTSSITVSKRKPTIR